MGGTSHDRVFHEPNRRNPSNGAVGRNQRGFETGEGWGEVPAEELQSFISRVVTGGACCIFSRSSDGGVLSLTVIFGSERWRAYPRSGDDALVVFRDILDALML